MSYWNRVLGAPHTREAYAAFVRAQDKRLGAFLEFDPERRSASHTGAANDGPAGGHHRRSGLLAGLPVAVKDNIAVAGFRLTCGSRFLEALRCLYTATAVRRLEAAGARVVGKTNLDEFGMGSSTDNSALGVTNNPYDHARVAGGSSGGSAAAVAAGLVPLALGSDTGGSVRQPASFCGVYGFKPTYGAVSRYGLVAFASSLDVVGACARDLDTLEAAFAAMRGLDERDHSSLAPEAEAWEAESGAATAAGSTSGTAGFGPAFGSTRSGAAAGAQTTGATATEPAARATAPSEPGAGSAPGSGVAEVRTVGVLTGLEGLAPGVQAAYENTIAKLRERGYELREISLTTLKYVVPAYYTIATAEASANLARYNGVRYGVRPEMADNPDELVRTARDEGFGPEVKLRILLGTYVLRSGFQDQYYLRAQRIRTAIRNELNRAFEQVQVILTPTVPVLPFAHGEGELTAFEQKLADQFTATASLAGIPALSVPGEWADGLPVGMQLLAPAFAEDRLWALGRELGEAGTPPDYPAFPEWAAAAGYRLDLG